MSKETQKNIFDSISKTILPVFFSFILSFVLNNINSEKVILRIGNITNINENQYVFNIDISNFQKKNVDNFYILIPSKINLSNINTDSYLNIEDISSTVNDNLGKSVFSIKNIEAGQHTCISIITNEKINIDDISINKNNNKIRTIYTKDENNPINKMIIMCLISSIAYFIILSIANYINNKRCNIINVKLKTLEERNTYTINELERIKIDNSKQKLLLISQISDLKKELDFWKDTIRKLLYSYPKKEVNKLFDFVTNNLKTYSVKYNYENLDFKKLKVINSILNSDKNKDK